LPSSSISVRTFAAAASVNTSGLGISFIAFIRYSAFPSIHYRLAPRRRQSGAALDTLMRNRDAHRWATGAPSMHTLQFFLRRWGVFQG